MRPFVENKKRKSYGFRFSTVFDYNAICFGKKQQHENQKIDLRQIAAHFLPDSDPVSGRELRPLAKALNFLLSKWKQMLMFSTKFLEKNVFNIFGRFWWESDISPIETYVKTKPKSKASPCPESFDLFKKSFLH